MLKVLALKITAILYFFWMSRVEGNQSIVGSSQTKKELDAQRNIPPFSSNKHLSRESRIQTLNFSEKVFHALITHSHIVF